MKKTLIISIVILSLFSCHSKTENELIIPLEYGNDKVLPFEESGYDYSYEVIPLETDTANVSSFIGQSYRFIVYKDCIYVPDNICAPKIFSTKGKFIKSFISGKGPGEITGRINDIYIDKENDYLEVSEYGKTSRFTLMGEYVENVKENGMCSDICKFGDYYIIYDGIISQDSCFFKMINHRTGKCIRNMFPKKLKDGIGFGWGLMANGVFMCSNNNVYFNIPFTDGIYKIEQGDSIPRLFAKIDNVVVHDECPEFDYWGVGRYAQSENKNVTIVNLSVSRDEKFISFKVIESRTEDKTIEHRVLYDVSQNKIFNYPVKMMDIVYCDGEYDYGMVFPERLEKMRDKISKSEKPLMDELYRYIDKNGIDTNPYVVKIKIFKK